LDYRAKKKKKVLNRQLKDLNRSKFNRKMNIATSLLLLCVINDVLDFNSDFQMFY
jgi:hypothetical protein